MTETSEVTVHCTITLGMAKVTVVKNPCGLSRAFSRCNVPAHRRCSLKMDGHLSSEITYFTGNC